MATDLYTRLLDSARRAARRTFPRMSDEELEEVAVEWARDRMSEMADREDSPTAFDRVPEEMLALRREVQS